VERGAAIPFLALALAGLGCGISRGGTGDFSSLGDASPFDASADSPAVDTFVGDTAASAEDGTSDAVDAPPCKPIGGGDLCAEIPKFAAATQVVDGVGDEFCDVPTTHFDPKKGQLMVPSPAPGWVKTDVRARFAWSASAFHAHVAVVDSNIQVVDDPFTLYLGDAVEVYIAGFSTLTGTFDGIQDAGAMQVVIAPPSGAVPARAEIFQNTVHVGSLPSGQWAARRVPGGYEIELRIPWTDLGGAEMRSGLTIGVDLGLDDKDGPADRFWSVYEIAPTTISICGEPSCDDRLWCLPSLK
jgi:hypothetical protein